MILEYVYSEIKINGPEEALIDLTDPDLTWWIVVESLGSEAAATCITFFSEPFH